VKSIPMSTFLGLDISHSMVYMSFCERFSCP
jgi:hypothetical protein